MKERFTLIAVVKELPVVVFLVYLAYVCVLFHGRDHRMLDYTLTFDHWWYFHHRLMSGEIAQWNPFSLLGKIAVQWNYIPLSVIISPFLLFTGLNLEIFHNLFIIGTFLSLSVLYFAGRVLKYDRFLCLVPVVVIVTGGYRYLCALLNHSTFLFFYPLAIVCLLLALRKKDGALSAWGLFTVLVSLSFIASRFEFTVYVHVFIVVVFFVLGMYQAGNLKRVARYFLLGAGLTVTILALTAWQLPYLITSTLENCRVSGGLQPGKLFDTLLLKWSLISLLYQPALILLTINSLLWVLSRYAGGKHGLPGHDHPVRMWVLFLIGVMQIAFVKLILLIPAVLGLDRVRAFVPPNTHPAYTNLDIILSWSGIVAVFLLITCYSSVKGKATVGRMFSFFAAMFAGFYVAEYSWHIWPINENTHFFFMIPLFAGFVPFGAVRLWMHRRAWILAVLVIFHFIGETGLFYIYEVFGIPWLAPRASLAEVPFQIILILESILFLTEGGSSLISRVFHGAQELTLFGRRRSILSLTNVSVRVICVLFAFFTLKMFLMPVGDKEVPGSSRVEKVYLREFPFADMPVDRPPVRLNKIAYEAKENSDSVREGKRHVNPFKRARVEGSVVSTSDNMFYKYLPAYSGTLNTAPLYATELPKTIRNIFIPDYDEKQGRILKKAHPEMNPTFIDYKRAEGKRERIDDIFGNQSTPVMIFPHAVNDRLYREILAEEGSDTPRAFLTKKVVRLNRYLDEYNFLNSTLANGRLLTDQITTSDTRFMGPRRSENASGLKYEIEFKKDEPENIALHVTSNEDGFLALMDAWGRGWKAYVDGQITDIYRGYIGTRFIELAKGTHIVEFKYSVPGLMVASIVSVISWILALVCIVLGTRWKTMRVGQQ